MSPKSPVNKTVQWASFIKRATKLQTKIMFVSATKIGENTTNFKLFLKINYPLSHQNKYLNIEN